MKFQAAVLHGAGRPLAIEQVAIGALRPTDVLVRLRASGLCHTDLEVIQGSLASPMPVVLGHEGAGVVEAVGAQVAQVKPGDHVVCSWNPNCGHCYYCDQGLPILCEPYTRNHPRGYLIDGTSRLTLDGNALHHFMGVSGHAEYCVVPEQSAVPVPREIPFDRACLIGCGVMTGFGAVDHIAPVTIDSNVLVVGCGAVGLNAIQGAALRRAGRIMAVDVDDAKLERARTFGATDTLNPRQCDALEAVREMTHGRGADFAFEAAGNEAAMQLAIEGARLGARIVILGKTNVDRRVSFRFGSLMGEKQIVRSSYGGARPRRDFPRLARAYLAGLIRLDELIDRRIRLDEINDAFSAMERGDIVRAVIVFDA